MLVLVIGVGPLPWAQASDHVRVALSERADHVTVAASGGLRLDVPSGVQVGSEVTMTLRGNEVQVNDGLVQSPRVAIQGGPRDLRVTLREPSAGVTSRDWVVQGGLEITVHGSQLLVVNVVELEDYVAGVVSSEVNPTWHQELLRTQAVAARTYALHKKLETGDQPFDVYADALDQVYTGRHRVTDDVLDAVRDTRGQILTYEGQPILAAYSSTAAGLTEDAVNVWSKDLPYLKGVECPFDQESPWYEWHVAIPFDVVESRLKAEGYPVGWLATLTPYRMTAAGRVKDVRILHSQGELVLTGQEFRRLLGYSTLRSTRFSIERIAGQVVFAGKGAGHGVGLCQWGAKEMAELGYPYQSILRYYYPGTELLSRDQVLMPSPAL